MKTMQAMLILLLSSGLQASDIGTVLGTLETPEYQLQLLVGDNESLYNVLDSSGNFLAKAIDKGQLSERWPVLADLAETGVADGAAVDAQHQQVPPAAETSDFIEMQ